MVFTAGTDEIGFSFDDHLPLDSYLAYCFDLNLSPILCLECGRAKFRKTDLDLALGNKHIAGVCFNIVASGLPLVGDQAP